MKSRIFIFFIAMLLIVGLSQSALGASKGPIKIDAINFLSGEAAKVFYQEEFNDYVNARACGKLVINYRGGQELFPMREQAEAVIKGVVDMTVIASTFFQSIVPEVILLAVSEQDDFGFHRVNDERKPGGVYDFVNEGMMKKGLYMLGRGQIYNPTFFYTNYEDFKTVDDIKKVKVAVPGTSYLNWIKALGGNPSFIQTSERYTALERGVVNSIASSHNNAVRHRWYEVIKYWIEPPFKTNAGVIFMMNLKKWKSLPKDMKDLLTEAMIWAESKQAMFNIGLNTYYEMILKSNGMRPLQLQGDTKYWRTSFDEVAWGDLKKSVSAEKYKKARELAKR